MVVYNIEELEIFENRIEYSFDKIWFHKLNKNKIDKTVGFWFDAPKTKACIIGGIRDDRLLFPYSSPFSMIETFKDCKNEELESYVDEINKFCMDENIKDTYFVLPPMIYNETNVSKWLGALLRGGYEVFEAGLNFQIEIGDENDYLNRLHKNGRKNLNNALNYNYELHQCMTLDEKKTAYEIIKENRQSKNYYLSMTWEEISNTISHLEHEFHILTIDGENIASAIIFRVTENIWQVIYWGERPGRDEARPMNYLPYALHNYYTKKGIKILDIGPSMHDGKPNYGLCDYKESIGCSVSTKFILRREFT